VDWTKLIGYAPGQNQPEQGDDSSATPKWTSGLLGALAGGLAGAAQGAKLNPYMAQAMAYGNSLRASGQ
jgi:hypothetical protein